MPLYSSTTAGGDLTGAYPNPTVKSSVGLTGTPTAPTASSNTNTTQIASTAYHVAQTKLTGGTYQIAPNTFATQPIMTAATLSAVPNAGDGRWARVMMTQTGTLHDVSALVSTTGGNYNLLVLDDGQANAVHTTRTALYIKGSTATPAQGVWMTGDAALSVNAGDTLVFVLTFDGTTAKMVCGAGATGAGTLPNTNFWAGSGASTASQKVSGTVPSANVPTTTSGAGSTVTDANMSAAANCPLFVWRIS